MFGSLPSLRHQRANALDFYGRDDSQSDFPLNMATLLRPKFNCKIDILVEKMDEGRRVCANASEPLFLLFSKALNLEK